MIHNCSKVSILSLTSYILSQIIFTVVLRQMDLYSDVHGRKIVYWLSNIGVRFNSSNI